MKTNLILLLVVASLPLLGCKDPIPDPEQAVLILPADNTSCLYVSQSSSTASVDFSWQEAQHTDEYLVVVKNLTTEEETTSRTVNTSLRLTLSRGVPYQWKVITVSELSSVETSSRSFSFYLEAQQQGNYLPFPARLLSPQVDEVVSLTNGQYNFSWQGEDLDNDLSHYTLSIGASADDLDNIVTDITASSFSTTLNAGEVYFWQIISYDQNGNSTKSLTNRFETAP